MEAAAAASESALKEKAAALAAADAAAAAEASKAQAQEEARWKEANEKLAAMQKQMQVGYADMLTQVPMPSQQHCATRTARNASLFG
jgi:hypothetical protein